MFSCERDAEKRDMLLAEGSMLHMFGDVAVFGEKKAYCYVEKKEIPINQSTCKIDLLLSGCVCKNLSTLNIKRSQYAGCYKEQLAEGDDQDQGDAGATYQLGFRKVGGKSICLSCTNHARIHILSIFNCFAISI